MNQNNNAESNELPCCGSEKKTNWSAWYIALLVLLFLQLIAFSIITKFYE